MKPSKSIKWRLQIWYGFILVLVLTGFGWAAIHLETNMMFQWLDRETMRRLDVLAQAVHPPPMPPVEEPGFNRPPPGMAPPQPPTGRRFSGSPEFHLPPPAEGLFGTNGANGFFFVITGRNGEEMARSDNAPVHVPQFASWLFLAHRKFHAEAPGSPPLRLNEFPSLRAVARRLPSGETVVVGCSIAPELKSLQFVRFALLGAGGIILLFGLAGGGWLVNRALRPIAAISAAAGKISAGDLAQRINTAETESELGQLAAVLNSTFARLEAAFAQQKQFAANAAHELRTPVSVILTQTQTALNRERSAADYRQAVEACQRAAQRMRRLIESLLELARFDAGQEILKRIRFDFSKTISDCVELVQPLADERRVKILVEAGPLELTGDPERLGQVATNLLTNAIQYNQPGGEVRVKLEAQAGLAVLTVSDTGRGIAAADLPRVFERFYRADQSRTGAGNAGLGLAICQAIVAAHGGTMDAASEVGQSAVFAVRLPA